MSKQTITKETTSRGFAIGKFADLYGAECSIQKSSLANDDAIWLGVDNANPQLLASEAEAHGIVTAKTTGWIPYPISEDVLLTTRMHLSRDQAAELIPILQKFVDTGDI